MMRLSNDLPVPPSSAPSEPAHSVPIGTVTFLFSDIEGSTQLLQRLGERYAALLAIHQQLMRTAFTKQHGHEVDTQGDSFFVAFSRASDAISAAVDAQRALAAHPWPDGVTVGVRMGLHTGEPKLAATGYVGLDVHRAARISAAGHGRQVLLSQTTRDLVGNDLPVGVTLRDLGEHRLKDLRVPTHIFQLVIADLPADFPPLKTLDTQPNNLPTQPTALIGREQEVKAVRQLLLRPDVRLVSLTGAGGSGKTRLGVQVAAELIDEFKDGVFFVALAPITDPNLVVSTIAQVLGIRETEGQPLFESLKDYLQGKQLLLVLDNFEQIISAAPRVAELLAACPQLKVLVTSREALHLRGEKEFPVPPLALPDRNRIPSLEALSQYESVELFVQRAVDVKPDFNITSENAPAVAEICHRLDGLPLAIELAAARTKLLPPQAMLTRLEHRLKFLTAGARDLPTRQQTLRSAIDWSYDLLNEGEKKLFRRLAVFVGGGTLEAVEAICNTDRDPSSGSGQPLTIDVLDGLASLVDKSLLRQEETERGQPRFMMLETIREYALERLGESGEEDAIRLKHARFFLSFADEAATGLLTADRTIWLERLDAELDNFRAILGWCRAKRNVAELGLVLAGTLFWYWYNRRHLTEGREWIEGALHSTESLGRTAARAHGLFAAGTLAQYQSDYVVSNSILEESVRAWREVGDKRGLAYALLYFGWGALFQSDFPPARQRLDESVALFREVKDIWGLALALHPQGLIANAQGELTAARAFFQESLTLFQQTGDKWGISFPLTGLARVAFHEGDYAAARAWIEQSLALRREMGDKFLIGHSLHVLGLAARAQQDYARAEASFGEGLLSFQEIGSKQGVALCLAGIAGIAGASGQPERAARLFGAAEALVESAGGTLFLADRADYERNVAAARAQLDEATFAKRWAEGRALSLEQAITYALDEINAETRKSATA